MHSFCTCLLGVLFFAATTSADELRLKDGSRIVGTIVGFEENSFKVQTSYGFAVVRKDQVVTIVVAGAERAAGAEKKAPEKKPPEPPPAKGVAPAEPQAKADPIASEPAAPTPAPAPSKPPEKNPLATPVKSLASTAPAKASEKNSTPATPAVARKQQAPPPAPAPVKPAPPPVPEQIREEVSRNSYANLTFGFRMYKPPDWEVIEGARKMLPSTITAMGTSDETTYLLIVQEPFSGPVEPHVAAMERRLNELLDNYRPLGEKQIAVAGAPAHERRFRGMVDNRDWSGVVVFVAHSNRLFTILGMTAADSDLVQIQENVITRAITSLEFTKQ